MIYRKVALKWALGEASFPRSTRRCMWPDHGHTGA